MIKRALKKQLIKYFKQYPVIVLTGPRQSGKTTLVKEAFPKMSYVNLEDIELREFAKNDPKGFLGQYPKQLIIDEAQYVPELFSYIQLFADKRNKNGQYILTGSQNFLLLEKINQSLAGRAAILKLLPLSLEEIKNYSQKQFFKDYSKFLFKGFYPKLYNEKIDAEQYYSNYIQTYIERDVRMIRNISNLSTFKKFISLLAARVGQILNISSLINECGVEYKTAMSWLSVLEASYIVFLLPPYYRNYNKRVVKSPKIYFYDPGIICSLLNISSADQIKTHYLKGELFENLIVLETLKQRYNQAKKENIFFWRDKTGHEIDLIIEEENQTYPIEIKSGQTIKDDFFKNLNYYNKLSGANPKNSYVVYGGRQKQSRSNGTVISWRNFSGEVRPRRK